MLHARIAARAFNTPLLVEPSKAMAFLSGLGPRILGRRVDLVDGSDCRDLGAAATPARAGILAGGLAESLRQQREAPYAMVEDIAIIEISGVLIHRGGWIGASSGQTSYEGIAAQIEAAGSDPLVRGVALEIDSFGGEVAGVFDLADRIRALRRDKPVWAFVAEHAFSAGYALASQADRILLPRTGALGSIGVVVMHADLSGQLDQDGLRVTLIHSGSHKVDGHPYAPLPDTVRSDIQREIDGLRFLFTETVAAGRPGRLSQEAALATEAATYRGVEAVTAGLADEVTDLGRGFGAFRQLVSRTASPSLAHPRRAPLAQTTPPTQPRKETAMTREIASDDSAEDSLTKPQDPNDDPGDTAGDAAPEVPAAPEAPASAAASGSAAALTAVSAPEASAAPAPVTAPPGTLAELTAQLRESAAEIAEIAAQAGRLGIAIDAAKALREGTTPEALRRLVLERASASADARDIIAAPPSPILPRATESPIVAAAKRAAATGARG